MERDERRCEQFAFGAFVLDVVDFSLTCNGEPVALAPKEFEVLLHLVTNTGRLVHKEDLIKQAWPNTFVSDSSLLRIVSVLRKHLGYDSIRTVPKRGYIFSMPVMVLDRGATKASDRSDGVERVPSAPRDKDMADASRGSPESDTGTTLKSPMPRPDHRRRTLLWLAILAAGLGMAVFLTGGHSKKLLVAADSGDTHPLSVQGDAAGAVRLFVLNEGASSISVVNALNNKVEATLPLPADPRGVTVLPDGSAVYVSLYGANRVVALDPRTNRITASIPVGYNPVGLAANPRPPFIYVANNYSNTVSVIDSRTNSVVRTLRVGSVPTEIVVSPDGRLAIVTNQSAGTVTLIDAVENTVLAAIPVGSTPVGITFTRDSRFAWVTLAGQDEAVIIDAAAHKIVGRVHVGPGPIRVAITPDGRSAILSNFFSNKLTIVDTGSLRSSGEIEVGPNPVGVTFDPEGALAYAVSYGSDSVAVIDLQNRRMTRTFKVGAKPVEVAVLPCYSLACTQP